MAEEYYILWILIWGMTIYNKGKRKIEREDNTINIVEENRDKEIQEMPRKHLLKVDHEDNTAQKEWP